MADLLLPSDHPARATVQPPVSPIDAVIDGVINRLANRLPARLRIERFPDKPEEYDFEGSDGAVLVLYDGAKFDAPGIPGAAGLRREFRLVVVALTRRLGGPDGGWGLIEDIRLALHGESFGGCRALVPVEDEFEDQAQGVARFRIVFAGVIPAVPVKPAVAGMPHGFAA